MIDEIEILEYDSKYSTQIGSLISSIQQLEFDIPITLDQQPDLKDIKSFYQKGKGNFWIALFNNKVVGTISLLDINNNQVALRKMFVDSDYRGSKYSTAKKLLDQTFAWAKKVEIKQIYLGTTEKFLAAHRFYEKNGFHEIAKSSLPESFPVMSVDSKFYKFDI